MIIGAVNCVDDLREILREGEYDKVVSCESALMDNKKEMLECDIVFVRIPRGEDDEKFLQKVVNSFVRLGAVVVVCSEVNVRIMENLSSKYFNHWLFLCPDIFFEKKYIDITAESGYADWRKQCNDIATVVNKKFSILKKYK